MALSMINKEREHHEIESLLPWHAAGTLDRSDAEGVDRGLAEDGELARRYELVREELAETIRLNERLGAPSAYAMEKLFAAHASPQHRSRRTAFPWHTQTARSMLRRRVRGARRFGTLAKHQS